MLLTDMSVLQFYTKARHMKYLRRIHQLKLKVASRYGLILRTHRKDLNGMIYWGLSWQHGMRVFNACWQDDPAQVIANLQQQLKQPTRSSGEEVIAIFDVCFSG
jgi:hypothetical protein